MKRNSWLRQTASWRSLFRNLFRNLVRSLLLATLALLCAACVSMRDPEASQEYRTDIVATLTDGSQAEQSFVSRRAGLNGIQLWLRSTPGKEIPAEAYLQLQLYQGQNKAQPVFSTRISPQRLEAEFPLSIAIPTQPGDPGQEYRLLLKPAGFDLDLFGRNEESYPRGAFSRDGSVQEADLSFRLSYWYGFSEFASDLGVWLSNIWLVVPLLLTLWLPGRVLLQAALSCQDGPGTQPDETMPALDWGERTALSLGLSLALLVLTLLWSKAIGFKWTAGVAWAVCLGLLVLLAWLERNYLKRLAHRLRYRNPAASALSNVSDNLSLRKVDWKIPALTGIFILAAGVRLAMVRDLAAPAWVDSVHHALVIRKILDIGMLPQTYLPYLESQYATYHSGFHAASAFFLWLSGMPLPSGILLFSQVINALCIFPVYLFTTSLTRNRLAGVFAALIAGLMTPMPAYYASWGRFTQLAGLLILPVALAFYVRLTGSLENRRAASPANMFRPPALAELVLLGISLAGLALTHYRVLAFLACLMAVYSAARVLSAAQKKRLSMTAFIHLAVLSASAGLAILLSLPWWPPVIHSLLFPQAAQAVASLGKRLKLFDDFAWGYLNTALGKQAMVLAGLGWIAGLLRRKAFPLILMAWVILIFTLANPGAYGIPGVRILNNTSVEIILFMPIALLGGFLLAEIVEWVESRVNRSLVWVFRPVVLVGALLAAFAGGRALMTILNQGTFLIRQADLETLQWAQDNLPAGEAVVVNSFLWGYNKMAGSDGGYWASALAGHPTVPPPVLHSLSNPLQIQRQSDQLSREIFDKSGTPGKLAEVMSANQLHYIIIGAKGGVLSPKGLVESGLFSSIYQKDGCWVLVLN